jgi:two-component system, LytTR family, response regulator
MKEIKTLLIDDEAGALNTLRGMLTEFCPQISIVGEASSVKDALWVVAQIEPELVFLDIEMPPFSGFDFLERTKQLQFGVIFTTAYPHFAIEAINTIQPWSYLVKPYSINSLLEAVQIATNKLSAVEQLPIEAPLSDNLGIILHDNRKGNIVLKVRDIQYCKSDGASLEIYVNRNGKTERFLHYQTLKDLESQLHPTMFCRVHHSFIVNLAHVDRYEITKSTRVVYLTSGTEIPVSIQKTAQFERKIAAFLQ